MKRYKVITVTDEVFKLVDIRGCGHRVSFIEVVSGWFYYVR